jgi:hypothetical protein
MGLTTVFLVVATLGLSGYVLSFGIWAHHRYSITVSKVVVPAPTSLVEMSTMDRDLWHETFCDKLCVSHCNQGIEILASDEGFKHRAPKRAIARAKGAIMEKALTYALAQVTWCDPVVPITLNCCASSTEYGGGYLLGVVGEVYITYEHAPDNVIRVSGITRRHCQAPPSHPLGMPHNQAAATNATWPGHWHTWLLHPPKYKVALEADEVGVWTQAVLPFRKKNRGWAPRGPTIWDNILPVLRFRGGRAPQPVGNVLEYTDE